MYSTGQCTEYRFPEPSGRTGPKGTGDGLNKYRGVEGESLALACAAQGFPAPISRYTQIPYIASLFFLLLLFGRLVLLRRARILFSKRSILTLYPGCRVAVNPQKSEKSTRRNEFRRRGRTSTERERETNKRNGGKLGGNCRERKKDEGETRTKGGASSGKERGKRERERRERRKRRKKGISMCTAVRSRIAVASDLTRKKRRMSERERR